MVDKNMPTVSREAHLQRLIGRIERLIERGTDTSSRFTKFRLAIFVVGLLCCVALFRSGWYQSGNVALAGFILMFAVVAAYHNRLESGIHRLRLWKTIKSVHLARIRLDWTQIPPRAGEPPATHLYAADLDLIGPHSLTHLIDTTVSDYGRERLHAWLLTQAPEPAGWEARQRLVKSLAPRSLFRDRLVLEAQLAGEQEINGRRLAAALDHPIGFPRLHVVLAVQILLATATAVLGISALLGWMPGYWMFSFAAYVLILLQTDQGEELLEHAVGLHHEMERFGKVLGYLEQQADHTGSPLSVACAPLFRPGARPSRHVARAARVMHAISIKAHPLVHIVINALCPWDLWFTKRLQQIQSDIGRHLPTWLDCLAEVEAASALATFADLHREYGWPAHVNEVRLSATQLGHPLISAQSRITNDFNLSRLGTIHLVTGSNMSGKSTFLRTIGINLCLAQAGGPVCAATFEWRWGRLACCIRVNDSLDAGLSFFYAEVKRLKSILDATEDRTAPPVLFLIDEIFKGTNNRERLTGSRAYIKAISAGNGLGLVSTHDLELTDLNKETTSLINFHFQENVTAGTLSFDYKLRPGPCPTTNALRIMELEGLPVSRENDSEQV